MLGSMRDGIWIAQVCPKERMFVCIESHPSLKEIAEEK